MHLQVCGQLLVDFREQLGEWGLTMSHLNLCAAVPSSIISCVMKQRGKKGMEHGVGKPTWHVALSVVISHPFMVEFQITTGGDDGMKITGFLHITGSRPSILTGYSIPLCHYKSVEWKRCFFLQGSEWCAIQWSILSNYIYIFTSIIYIALIL